MSNPVSNGLFQGGRLVQRLRSVANRDYNEPKNNDVGKFLDSTESTAECDPHELVEVSISAVNGENKPCKADESVHSNTESSSESGSTSSSSNCSSKSESNSIVDGSKSEPTSEDIDTQPSSDFKEESLAAALVELKHDVREKTSQCEILRETLSSMSMTMKNQAQQIGEKNAQIEEQERLLKAKSEECEEWKQKYEKLSKDKAVSSYPPRDPLLADPALSVYTNRPRGQSVRSNRSQFLHGQPLEDDDDDDDDHCTDQVDVKESSHNTDSEGPIGGHYGLTKHFSSSALDLVMRSPTNRTRPFKPKKRKPTQFMPLKTIAMSWITGDAREDKFEDVDGSPDAKIVQNDSVLRLNPVMDENKSIDESELSSNVFETMDSDLEAVAEETKVSKETTAKAASTKPKKKKKTEAERRRARVRRMAKREARHAAFDIQQLDV